MNVRSRSIEKRVIALESSKASRLIDQETFCVVEADWPCRSEEQNQWAYDLAQSLGLPPHTSLYVRRGDAAIPPRIIIKPNQLANLSEAEEAELFRTAEGPILLVAIAPDNLVAAFDAPNGYFALMDEAAAEMEAASNVRTA